MGYDVHVVARTKKESVAQVDVPFRDARNVPRTNISLNGVEKIRPLFIPATVKAKCDVSHHSLKKLKKFQPVRHLSVNDVSFHDIPVVYWGDHFLTPWAPEVIEMVDEADFVFCDTEMYVRMESDLDIADKHIQFVHFPTVKLMPIYKKEPKMLWANSTFTRSWIRIRWGYNNPHYTKVGPKYAIVKIPTQVFNAEVVHPPLYIEDYKNNRGFDDRPYDVVMFARLGEDKFTVAGYLNENFKLLTMGALSPLKRGVIQGKFDKPFKPKGDLHVTVTFKQLIELLRQAKVYVHGKGFGTMPITGGQSLPEHFGITVCEAMASGCPAVVPRAGGCWTDISMLGKYTLAYSSLEELKAHVKMLVTDEKEWWKWHNISLEGVQRFSAEKVKARVKELLS